MKCARLHLQERTKALNRSARPITSERPRRYCQKRMVNPDHEEDPRWTDLLQRYHCNTSQNINESLNVSRLHQEYEDIFLSVQNLQFQGNEQQKKRSRTCFKYTRLTDGRNHRMFVKQAVQSNDISDEDCASQLTCYYCDSYTKYLQKRDQSRPSSGKSSICLPSMRNTFKENKATQVDICKAANIKNIESEKVNPVISIKNNPNRVNNKKDLWKSQEDTKIAFHSSGKRKSLTISRAQSPETVQVIRVDVVCNYSSGSSCDSARNKKQTMTDQNDNLQENKDRVNLKNSHFAQKYLLTNTTKTLEERVSSGAKVTLLCKTFRLSDRLKIVNKKST